METQYLCKPGYLGFLSVQTLIFISSNAGGIKRKQQKKRIGGENQESQAGQGEGWEGEAGEAEEEAAVDWYEQR